MFSTAKENLLSSGNTKIDILYHNVEWLVTAFAGTLVFIIFVMQVYRIPTGSMAETLRGAHFRVRCGQCGYQYDHDFISGNYGMANTANPPQKLPIMHPNPAQPGTYSSSRCPSCGHFEPPLFLDNAKRLYTVQNNRARPPFLRTVFKGDQIFVFKSVYQFFQPKRWDVIVFKNPTEPNINYIKRCIGLPGEELVILDGDIFINGQIQRKPEKVQEELWMTFYNNDYQPVRPDERSFNGHSWKQPFENVESSKWSLFERPTLFSLNAGDGRLHRIQYNHNVGNDFRSTYGYDNPMTYPQMPICSDLMVQYYVTMEGQSTAGAQIRKYGTTYQGLISSNGTLELFRLASNGEPISLLRQTCGTKDLNPVTRFRFATLDRQLVLEYGKTKLVYDLNGEIDASEANRKIAPQVQILGSGQLQLAHVELYRDIYYLSGDDTPQVLRASLDSPMHLEDDEFFACGDNSPYSSDSRMWNKDGLANNGKSFSAGVVPKDYLVGKAFFVHWPGGYRLKQEPIRWIPYPDGMKIIYGGE